MKNITNSLVPFAVFVLFGACLVSIYSLLMVLTRSVGLEDGLPMSLYQRLDLPVISVGLPIVGIILFAAILLGLPRKHVEALKPPVIEGATNVSESDEGKKEEPQVKAA